MKMTKHLHGIMLGAALTLFAGATVAQDRPRDDRGRPEDQNSVRTIATVTTIATTTMRGGRNIISARKIVSTSARITRKTSDSGASIQTGAINSAPVNGFRAECA